ncbi:putative ABC transport system ATP-binding protein [Peribacillus deserti]|uniref:ABC transport system ATP-binding protein n=1 Tax=Peribacillus deserti TaxID=673318 RepID=A0ABS2QEK1_9BACI|nr:ABC transporter ATP-binding protein [Peribacillus deserti]MBM7691129.1 putative ABC transport system ATP-binding protein [Peribacillus deserti]
MFMLEANNVSKIYCNSKGAMETKALKGIDIKVEKGEFVGVMGPSGSGKTTLLNVIATIDRMTSGEIYINGSQPHELKKRELAKFRRTELGFVFQNFNLLDTLTIGENMLLPLTLEGIPVNVMKHKQREIAQILGITDILEKRTYEVSGGQAQRAAIGRAIIHSPSIVLADEPTGNLDSKSSQTVMETLQKINHEKQATIMMVTHDPFAASYCDRVIFITDGELYNQIYKGDNRSAFYQEIINVLSMLGGSTHDFSAIRP